MTRTSSPSEVIFIFTISLYLHHCIKDISNISNFGDISLNIISNIDNISPARPFRGGWNRP